jgi:hypothetical protein
MTISAATRGPSPSSGSPVRRASNSHHLLEQQPADECEEAREGLLHQEVVAEALLVGEVLPLQLVPVQVLGLVEQKFPVGVGERGAGLPSDGLERSADLGLDFRLAGHDVGVQRMLQGVG